MSSVRHFAAPAPLVVVTVACAGFLAAGAAAFVGAGTGCFIEVFVTTDAVVGRVAVFATARRVTADLGWTAPFVLAAGTTPAGCVTAVLATVVPIALAFVFAFTAGEQGAAALAVAGEAAGFFLRANIDPRLLIAAEAFVIALLAVPFCAPVVFAKLVSVPDVVAPGGHG